MSGKQLIIIGAGGFGREVLAWARQSVDGLPVKGFIDDRWEALSGYAVSVPIIGTVNEYFPRAEDVFVCAMGNVNFKQRCIEKILARGGVFGRVVHRTATLGDNVKLGDGVIVCPHAVIGSDAVLGNFVTINYHSTVAHDARIGDWTQLHCHVDVTGGVTIGERVTIGSHASILPRMKVGDGSMIGAGSIVMRDVTAGSSVFGSPARPLVQREGVNV